jgi:ATP-dependent exoDNAse (exonuclease V) beta subunit
LARIWAGIESQVRLQDTAAAPPAGAVNPNALLLRRREPLPEAGEPAVGDSEPNLPEQRGSTLVSAVGTVVHLTLQRLSAAPLPPRLDRSLFESWWRRQLQALGLGLPDTEEALARLADSVEKVLADETGRWLLSPEREQAVSELPVSCLLPDGRLAEYVIDRSFVHDTTRWLVDYKNSVPDSGQSLTDFLAAEELRYRPQLETYAYLLTALHGQPVRSALYFTALPYWHELD